MIWENFPDLGDNRGRINFLTMEDGTRLRSACWPADQDSRGIVVLVNGHQEYMEKYSEFISELLGRGFALYTLDNRGQGLSDRLLSDRSKSHAENFDLFSNDLNEFISGTVLSDPRAQALPIYLIGHSMGGHICLRYLHDFPGAISKAVIMAPMIDFYLGADFLKTIAKFSIRLVSRLGFGTKYAFGQKNSFSKAYHLIRQRQLTHDKKRYADEQTTLEAHPDLYAGGATFGWLDTAIDSIDKIHEPGFLNKITLPMMVVLAGEDRVVDSEASRKLLAGHDNIAVVTIEGAR
ncbi:MAG: alpha/beta hydrolase, partial [Alphaproteobacteria bacterium]|nr:alpha/beta hydrolase [Alphaproteobacteria bacterium]